MPDCEKQHTELVAVNKSKHFRGRGVELVKPGWRSVYSLSPFAAPQDGSSVDEKEVDDQSTTGDGGDSIGDGDEEEATTDGGNLCSIASKLKENDTLACVLPAEVKCEHTRPPPLLNEASLLFLMETAAKYVAKKGGSACIPSPHSDPHRT
jgi:DNA topoisomerase IA